MLSIKEGDDTNNYIVHNDRLIKMNDDMLMHYKYLYKKRVNGKWRYYYDIGEAGYIDGYTGKKPSNIKGYSKIQDALGKDERDRYTRAAASVSRAEKNYYAKRNDSSAAVRSQVNTKYVNAGRKFAEARSAYMKTPLGRLEQVKNSIQKAKNTVAGWLEKAAKKLRK